VRTPRWLPVGRGLWLASLWLASLLLASSSCGRSSAFLLTEAAEAAEAAETAPELNGDPIVDGCSKVDYLFVIDNSESMDAYHRRVVQNFSTFVDGVSRSQDSLESLHVGIVTTDAYVGNAERCNGLGDLVTHTAGTHSSEENCGPFAEGYRFMTAEDDLAQTFACAAQVGTDGSGDELPLNALAYALHEDRLAADGCNAGFLRDDALLVVVIVTDEDDDTAVDFAYSRAVEAKHGYEDNIVVVALVIPPPGYSEDTPHRHHNVLAFAESFEHSFVGAVYDEDYGPTFEAALDIVQNACG